MDDLLDCVEAPRLDVLATLGLEVPGWYSEARCRDADPSRFFPPKGQSTDDAVRICWTCPVREDCLDYAMRREYRDPDARDGVWGGLTASERARLARVAAA